MAGLCAAATLKGLVAGGREPLVVERPPLPGSLLMILELLLGLPERYQDCICAGVYSVYNTEAIVAFSWFCFVLLYPFVAL